MRVHLLVDFTTVDQARAAVQATHGTAIVGIVLCSDDLDAHALGEAVPVVAGQWITPVSVLADGPVSIDTTQRRGWSFIRESSETLAGVRTAFDLGGVAKLGATSGDNEVAVVLPPDGVSFDALAGVVDHLIVDARDPSSARVDLRAAARIACEAARRGRSRSDTRRWQALGDIVTLAPPGAGLRDPAMALPEGWSVDEDDLAPVRATTQAELNPGRWYYSQPRVGNPYDDAPLVEGNGGVLYLEDHGADRERFAGALAALRAPARPPYAAFLRFATDVAEQRFLTELRIFAGESLGSVLGWPDDHPDVEQSLDLADLLTAFAKIASEDTRAYGALGEDGDEAYAAVGFGLWTENATRGVLRFWSRPYLVLK